MRTTALLFAFGWAACRGAPPSDRLPPDSSGGESGLGETAETDPETTLEPATPTPLADATPGWFGQLAYSPIAGAWLVASQSGGVVGRMMGDDGSPRSEVFAISPADQTASWAPAVAYTPKTDAFLVVWVDYTAGWQAWGRFVGSDGVPRSEPFGLPIDQPISSLGGDRTSALAYDEGNARFVWAWHGTHLATIGLDGALGAVVDLVDASPHEHWGASVAVDPVAGEYCVAYDRRNDPSFALSPVDAATLRLGTETTVGVTTTNVLVLRNTQEGRYLVVYDTGYVTGVKAMVLGSCDLGDVVAAFDVLPGIGTAAAWNPRSDQYAVIAQNAADDGNTWVVFDSTGARLAQGDPYLADSQGNFAPEIAPNPQTGTFAAISSREYSQTRFVARLGFQVASTGD
jgi:hypothetical protein